MLLVKYQHAIIAVLHLNEYYFGNEVCIYRDGNTCADWLAMIFCLVALLFVIVGVAKSRLFSFLHKSCGKDLDSHYICFHSTFRFLNMKEDVYCLFFFLL